MRQKGLPLPYDSMRYKDLAAISEERLAGQTMMVVHYTDADAQNLKTKLIVIVSCKVILDDSPAIITI